jgi:hypothetical protein
MALVLYAKALWKHWWTLLSCAVFTFISLIVALTNRSNMWIVRATGISAFALLLVASYLAWQDEYDRAEKEKGNNETAPHMDINVLSVVPHAKLQKGLTDLFLHVGLVLAEPSQVRIENFSITISDNSESSTFVAADDVDDWEHIKHEPSGDHTHMRCAPLNKELTRRGDYVRGWLHFPLPSLPESFVQYRFVMLKVNCTHGTCYTQFEGAYVHPDPYTKGVMKKILDEDI